MDFYDYRKAFSEGIPNLPDSFRFVKENDILSVYHNDTKLFRMGGSGLVDSVQQEKMGEIGFLPYAGMYGDRGAVRAFLDGLYYSCNPVTIHSRTHGRIKVESWKALSRRLLAEEYIRESTATKQFLDAAIEEAKQQGYEEGRTISEYINVKINAARNTDSHMYVTYSYFTDLVFPLRSANSFHVQDITGNERDFTTVFIHFSEPIDGSFEREGFHYTDSGWVYDGWDVHQGRLYNDDYDPYEYCESCEEYYPVEVMVDGSCYRCNSQEHRIHGYSTRAERMLKFKAKKVDPEKRLIYYGIEIEYESSNRDLDRVSVGKLLKGHAIMKSDGSINEGFEIVTCPATADIHLEVFKKFYEEFHKMTLMSANNVGMHIHISRKPLSTFCVGRMTEFLNREDNKQFLVSIAGREPNHYCQQEKRTVTYPVTTGSGNRYNMLNLNNEATVEVRIFSSPTSYEEFARKLQFVEALTTYAQPCQVDAPLKEQTYHGTFIQWLKGNRKFYPELSKFLKSSM